MRKLEVWQEPTPPEVLFLTKDDLTPTRSIPTIDFTSRVAEKVVRRGNLKRPGFVVIPNTKEVFCTREEVFEFQCALMRRLGGYIERRWPSLLKPYFIDGGTAKDYKDYKLVSGNQVFVPGLDTNRRFHADFWSQHYVSICYYRKEGVVGGFPRFLDLFALQRARRIKNIGYFMDPRTSSKYPLLSLWAILKSKFSRLSNPLETRVVDLNFRRDMPIIVFSNQYIDGIMHGVSPLTEVGAYPARSISYCSTGYEPR